MWEKFLSQFVVLYPVILTVCLTIIILLAKKYTSKFDNRLEELEKWRQKSMEDRGGILFVKDHDETCDKNTARMGTMFGDKFEAHEKTVSEKFEALERWLEEHFINMASSIKNDICEEIKKVNGKNGT